MKHPVLILLVALAVLALFQAGYYQLQLPALVATHFDAAGRATGWMTRAYFFRYQMLLTLGFTAVFGGLTLIASILPDRLINLPHKAYWFAPARREATRRRLAGLVPASGCGALAFFVFLHQRIVQANLDGTHHLTPSFGVIWAVALVLIVGPIVRPLWFFWKRSPPG